MCVCILRSFLLGKKNIHSFGGFGAGGEEELKVASLVLDGREVLESDVLEPGALEQRAHLLLREAARVRDDVLVLGHEGRLALVRLDARNVGDGERAARLEMRDDLARDVLDRGEVVVRHRALWARDNVKKYG
jgi:hypothetical protein